MAHLVLMLSSLCWCVALFFCFRFPVGNCNTVTELCQAATTSGGGCKVNADCLSPQTCQDKNGLTGIGVCTPSKIAQGSSGCTTDTQCESPAFCLSGTCRLHTSAACSGVPEAACTSGECGVNSQCTAGPVGADCGVGTVSITLFTRDNARLPRVDGVLPTN